MLTDQLLDVFVDLTFDIYKRVNVVYTSTDRLYDIDLFLRSER